MCIRDSILKMPQEVYAASGIVINGRRLKSFVFTTDLAIIRNCDADAVFAVYPFTPQQAISDAIIKASYIPVFCGVGGGTTHGVRTLNLARDVESQGAMGVVLNSPISDLNLLAVSRVVDIPVIITVTKENTNIQSRIDSGASILNVACSTDTPRVVAKIREQFPDVPIIASGGAGKKEDFLELFHHKGIDAGLAAGIFHQKLLTIHDLKTYLNENGVEMRL